MKKNKREFSLNAKNLASANLGQKIRFYRQIAGMTQKDLGIAVGVIYHKKLRTWKSLSRHGYNI